MLDFEKLDFLFNPVIIATCNPFVIETISTRKIGGEVITQKNCDEIKLFKVDTDIIDKIIELSNFYSIRIGKFNLLNRIIFLIKKNKILNQLAIHENEFYMLSEMTNDNLKKFKIELSPVKIIDQQNVLIIGSCQKIIVNHNSNEIWFDSGKFRTIRIK